MSRTRSRTRKPHTGKYMLDVYIPHDGGPPQLRQVPITGPDDIRRALARRLGCDPDELEQIDLPDAACFC